jgi:hypothetical protein
MLQKVWSKANKEDIWEEEEEECCGDVMDRAAGDCGSASTAAEGEWLQVELRGMPSRSEPDPAEGAEDTKMSTVAPPARIRAMVFFASLDQR